MPENCLLDVIDLSYSCARAYLAGLPGLPGKALASDTRIVSDSKQMTKEKKKEKK